MGKKKGKMRFIPCAQTPSNPNHAHKIFSVAINLSGFFLILINFDNWQWFEKKL